MVENAQPAVQARHRRWYQCSSRTLLPFVVVCALVAACFAIGIRRATRTAEAEMAVASLGGHIRQSSESEWNAEDTSLWPAYAKDKWNPRSGKSRSGFHSPVLADGFEVDLQGKRTTDAGVAAIPFDGLSPLRTLNLAYTSITDAGLQRLAGLNALRALDLADATITDSGLQHLDGMKQLQWLDLSGTNISDRGMTSLKSLTQLQWLSVRNTHISDSGLTHLERLSSLERLSLVSTNCTNEGVQRLQRALPDCKIEWPQPRLAP